MEKGCKRFYNPFVDKQIYCRGCQSWYNVCCLLPLTSDNDVSMDDPNSSDSGASAVRIIRGLGWVVERPNPDPNSQMDTDEDDEADSQADTEEAEDYMRTKAQNEFQWLIWGNTKDLLGDWVWKAQGDLIAPYRMKARQQTIDHCRTFVETATAKERLRCPKKTCHGKSI
jgi:hypothetical protein